jgi:serine/threonine-protein kinase
MTIHDVSHQDGYYFIVMEFVEGKTLDQVVADNGRLPLPRIQRIIAQVVNALEHAHQRGLIHRDIKPTNIMVDEERNDQVTLMDFGLVRAAEDSGLTKTGTIVGTPEYMSPEQAEGEDIDHRTDIYSLGVVLYKMLTGRVPFSKSTPHAVLIAHITQEPPSISSISPGLPAPIEAVVRKALAKDRDKRYARANDMARDLGMAARGEMPPDLKRTARPRVPGPRAAGPPMAGPPAAGPPAVGPPTGEPTVATQRPVVKQGIKGWMWGLGALGVVVLLGICGFGAFALGLVPVAPSEAVTPTDTATPVPPSPTATETVAPTDTPTVKPSPTDTPSPTDEPSPSPTGEPTATSEPTETPTPRPTDTATPRPTSAVTSTPRPTDPPQVTAPQAVGPPQGGTYQNPISFQWNGSLGAGQAYQVTAYHPGSGEVVQSGALTDAAWVANLPEGRVGEWVWYVSVIQNGSAVTSSPESMFWFDPFGGGGGGGGGGGDDDDGGGGGGGGKNTPAPP